MINEQKRLLETKEEKMSDITFCFEVSDASVDFKSINCVNNCTVYFVTKRKIVKVELAFWELKAGLNRINKVKMVIMLFQYNQREYIHDTLCEMSRERGICSPIIELDNAILYFPELRYSDMGLLAFLCEQKINMKNYTLSMTSGSLIGGKYV